LEKEPYNMKSNFAACVILYHPKKEDIANISTYSTKVEKVYILDNTEEKSNENLYIGMENVSYFWDGENKGLSVRLNEACKKAIADNFDYLLTMDQDSSFLEENIDRYFKDILNFKGKEKVAVYGLEYSENDINDTTENYIEVDHLITSASVINLQLYTEIGGFDENLFIDGVDIDYCYSALSKGFKNIKFARNFFNHSLGVRSRRGSIFTLYLIKKNVSVHSSLRVYYMYRNMLYIKNKYENVIPDIIKKFVKNQKHQVNKNIKYSNEFFTILKYKRKAVDDFNNKKMGKLKNFI
jgi:rhamnosyltransferase